MSRADFKLSYEISPIILNGGIAGNVPGGIIPIVSLLQPQDFSGGLLSPGDPNTSLDDFVAHFYPMPGGSLFKAVSGKYPFANQYVAANAMIFQPLTLSLRMTAPAPTNGGYPLKLAAFSSLKSALDSHVSQGGTFTVATPAYIYPNGLLNDLRDITGGDGHQVQVEWQWDFEFPLLTAAAAQKAQNSLMAKVTAGTQTTGDPPSASGIGNTTGNPQSGQGPNIIPPAGNQSGTNTGAGQNPPNGGGG